MFEIIKSPKFMEGFDPADPLNRMLPEAAERSGAQLATQIDTFVRKALERIVSPDTLAFFVDTRMSIPELDLLMTLNAPHSRTLEVRFKKELVAKVRIDTEMTQDLDDYLVTHVMRELPLV